MENARGLAQSGHQVSVFTAERASTHKVTEIDGVQIHWLPTIFQVGNAPFVPDLIRLSDFDIIHLHYPFIFGQEMLWLNSIARHARYVITYHQDLILQGAMGAAVKAHHATVGKTVLARAERLIVTSLDYGCASRVAPFINSKPNSVREIPNGVDIERFRPGLDTQALRQQYQISDDEPVILFVGGLDKAHYFKGVDVLIESLTHVDNQQARLLIVGDGDLRSRYEALAESLGLAKRVSFCGRVSDDVLPLYYSLSDLVVLPSTTMGEAFGIVLLEAMACGKPVIASRLPGVRSVVNDGNDGLLTTPGDASDLAKAINSLLSDPQKRIAMGKQGRMKIEECYSWPHVITRLEQVYEELMTT